MSIMNKLFTAVRGAFTEAGEAAVDSQAMRILDQEMKDAKKHLDEAKENLAKVMAEQMGVEREVKRVLSRCYYGMQCAAPKFTRCRRHI